MTAPFRLSRWLAGAVAQFRNRLFGSSDQALPRPTKAPRPRRGRKGTYSPQFLSRAGLAELAQLPDDHLIPVHTEWILLGRLLPNGLDQLQQVLSHFFSVWGQPPSLPAVVITVVDED